MDVQGLKRLRGKLDRFLGYFRGCVKTAPSRRHLRTYVAGQVGPLERKTAASIALEAGVPPRSLQEFLGLHVWDEEALRDRVQQRVIERHAAPDAIAVIDETSFPKKGAKTTGVKRQYCGATGKVDNCVVAVHLGYAAPGFHALLDADLYVPEDWLADPERCEEAGIPKTLPYRPAWRIALDLVRHALENGVGLRWLTADEAYGQCREFRAQVAAWGLRYVVEVPCSQCGWTKRPRVVEPGTPTARAGRPLLRARLAPTARRARRVDALWKRRGPAWEAFHIKDTAGGPVVWEARLSRFFPWDDNLPGPEAWLLVARNVLDGEVKYFLSNAPADTPAEVLLHVAFSRCHVEQLFEESKGRVGLDHFEVRHYLPLKRHLFLSLVSLLFLEEQTERLRGEKSGVDPLPGPPSPRRPTRPRPPSPRTDPPPHQGARPDPVLAEDQRPRRPIPLQGPPPQTQTIRHPAPPTQEVLRCILALSC